MYNWGQTILKIDIEEYRSFKEYGLRFLNNRGINFDCDFSELFENISYGPDNIIFKSSFDRDENPTTNAVFDMIQNYIDDMMSEDERYDYFGAATITDNIDDTCECGGIDDAPFINMEIDHNTYDVINCHNKLNIIID